MAYLNFIEVIPAEFDEVGFWAVIEGRDGKPEIIDDCFDTFAEAEREGKEWRQFILNDRAEYRHECAMEAGMLHGIDAYNDAMGY